jgi:hypothetical protein
METSGITFGQAVGLVAGVALGAGMGPVVYALLSDPELRRDLRTTPLCVFGYHAYGEPGEIRHGGAFRHCKRCGEADYVKCA